MKKIASEKAYKILLLRLVKTLLITVAAVLLYSFLFSEIIYRLDLSLESAGIISLVIVLLSAFTVGFISCYGAKGNGALLGILSELPLVFYTLINVIFHEANVLYFFIKLAIILLTGALAGILAVKKGNRLKV